MKIRGQSLPLDYLMALFVFLITFVYFMVINNLFTENYAARLRRVEAEISSINLAEQLVSHSGNPQNWTVSLPNNIASIGLASRSGELDKYKLCYFFGSTYTYSPCNQNGFQYEEVKELLGIKNDFFIKIERPDGIIYATMGEQFTNKTPVSSVMRIARLDEQTVYVKVEAYGT